MAEPTIIRIVFDGTVSGLSDHRLSLGVFSEPLSNLLKALRRIATTGIYEAIGKNPSKVGRFPDMIRQLDIELFSIVPGSGGIEGQIAINTPPGETLPMFDIVEWSGIQLLDAIDEERRGNLRNEQVRKYLKSLPSGLTHQGYSLRRNGEVIRSIEFGDVDLPSEVYGLPHLIEILGKVTGVGFEPGKNQVRFMTEQGEMTIDSTSEHVNYALKNRAHPVRALILIQQGIRRLLSIQMEKEELRKLDTKSFIYERWNGLLQKLAQ